MPAEKDRVDVPLLPPPGELLNNVVLDSDLLASWYENITSSIKPEVHNLSQRRQTRTKPRTQATCTKIGEVRPCGFRDMQADRQTDRQTNNKQTDILVTIDILVSNETR